MTRIDFYGLPEVRHEARERFAVRLVTRAWREGLRSLLLVTDDTAHARLDEALWGDESAFLPHATLGETDALRAPVLLATPPALDPGALVGARAPGLLVNLTDTVPDCFAAFDRVAEIVCQDDEVRARGREHYRFYRERGYPLEYHELDGGRGR
jgi:DNA polymerase-3 subunit chi